MNRAIALAVLICPLALCQPWAMAAEAAPAADSMSRRCAAAGVQAGLVVLVGCDDARAAADLAATGGMLVHVLDPRPAVVAAIQAELQRQGLYGLASAELLAADGKLPYTENLVNLLVLGDVPPGRVPLAEVLRVLCPGGVLLSGSERWGLASRGEGRTNGPPLPPGDGRGEGNLRWSREPQTQDLHPFPLTLTISRRERGPDGVLGLGPAELVAGGLEDPRRLGDGWLSARKPWPKAMDQWSHARHAADGNPVSGDRLAGPPRRVRWVAGPQQEVSNMVTAGGRAFFAGVLARDAFNGLRLWQRTIEPSPARGGFSFQITPASVRPVAAEKFLLVVNQGQLQALDACTGKLLREYPQAGRPTDILLQKGTIIAADKESLRAVDAQSGQLRWKQNVPDTRSMVAGDGAVFVLYTDRQPANVSGTLRVPSAHVAGTLRVPSAEAEKSRADGTRSVPDTLPGAPLRLACRSMTDGHLRWEQSHPDWLPKVCNCVYHAGLLVCEVSTLADSGKGPGNAIHVLAAADGTQLWMRAYIPGASHKKQARAMFAADLLWVLEERGGVGLDPRTGAVRKRNKARPTHCFPPVASVRYLFSGEMDLTDLATGRVDANPITKTACSRDAGVVPANGLLYTFPKHCICWPMLRDYAALAPARPGGVPPMADLKFVPEAGPARLPQTPPEDPTQQWPCYRHDALRSGATAGPAPGKLSVLWSAALGGRPGGGDCPDSCGMDAAKMGLSPSGPRGAIAADWRDNYFIRGPIGPPVVANGLVYVTRPDAQQVLALDLRTGRRRWSFTANGRVDTAPTIHRGLCLFGCKSGYVYALRGDDGGLVWRLRAAPVDERIVAYGQLESPWPVPGSVLVVDDVAYFAAGRQPLADGGVLVFAVDPGTGRTRWVQRLDHVPQTSFYGSSGLEFDNFDLLQQEGPAVAMSRWLFDRADGRMICRPQSGFAAVSGGVMFPRGAWSYAPRNESEQWRERPFVRPLAVFRDSTLYCCSQDRRSVFRRDFPPGGEKFNTKWYAGWETYGGVAKGGDLWRSQRLAHAAAWRLSPFAPEAAKLGPADDLRTHHAPRDALPLAEPVEYGEGGAYSSAGAKQPVAAMILAGDCLLLAGARGSLAVVETSRGTVRQVLDTPPPLWDGLAVAEGRLLLATADGRVLCLGR